MICVSVLLYIGLREEPRGSAGKPDSKASTRARVRGGNTNEYRAGAKGRGRVRSWTSSSCSKESA